MKNFYIGNFVILICIFSLISITSCVRPIGNTAQEKRDYVNRVKDETLAALYAKKPETRDLVENSPGYAVFSNLNTYLLFVGTGGGYGVVVDNTKGGRETYMNVTDFGIGLGIAVKEFKEVLIFTNKYALESFIKHGWDFGVEGDAAIETGTTGGGATGEVSFNKSVIIYQLTDVGVALKANLMGSKYSVSNELNYY